jgi:hypothetical protein
LSSVRVDISPAIPVRKRDISSWEDADISRLSSRGEKRYNKRKSAIKDYFTTEDPIDEITLRHHISPEILLKLAEQCLMQHEDGTPWGYRALLPGMVVTDHSSSSISSEQETGKDKALKIPRQEPPGEVPNSVSGEPNQQLSENKLIEDEKDTAECNAIKISPTTEHVEVISPASLNNKDRHKEIVDEEMDTAVADIGDTITEAGLADVADDVVIIAAEEEVSSPIAPIPAKSRMEVITRESFFPAVLPLYGKGKKRVDIKKIARMRRSMHKRWIHYVQTQRKQSRFYSMMSTAVVVALLIVFFIPLGTGLAAYSAYNSIRGVALDGVNNLLEVKSLLPSSKSDPLAALDAGKLQQAQHKLSKAESDFLQLQQLVNRPDIQSAIGQFAPQYSNKLDMAQRLVQVGIDVSRMGNELIGVELLGANIFHSSPLASASASTKPLITVADISNAEGVMIHALYYINDIHTLMSQVSIQDLPISNAQKKELTSVMALLPKVQDMIVQGQGLIGIVSWLLGVGQARHFLVQTMDRAELRPSGGFTGLYGVLTIQDGRIAPFTLTDVTELDYNGNGMELGRQAPPEYRSWMKFGFWGLRDSNLSGDYPTTARLSMQVFQEEGGGPVDGDISLTPTVIAHVLNVIGPIKVPQYNETITAQNLEDKLHYYQQDFGAIALQRQITGTHNAATRKAFTALLGKLLLDKLKHQPVKQLLQIMQNAVKDIQSRDLEIYFTDPLAESWVVQHGFSGGMDTFSRHDGFMVVQSNISISKASQYVHTTEQDNITLDAQGGTLHDLTITLDYKQTGPVYGYDTYADYIRVYAPANAQFISGNGFDSLKSLCIPNPTPGGPGGTQGLTVRPPKGPGCKQYNNSFPSNARYCPGGNYSLGPSGYSFGNWPVDSLSGPTELTSDLPGRAMWGGLTLTPKNCTSTITLQWYVPNEVKNIPGQSPYTILVQKQGGYSPTVQITIDTSAVTGLQPFSFQGDIATDKLFSLPPLKT